MLSRFFLSSALLVSLTLASGCTESREKSLPRILNGASKVDVFRVAPESNGNPRAVGTMAGYAVLATGKSQGPEFAGKLAKILLSEDITPNRKKCGFSPGIGYRIWNGDQSMDVLVCFSCDTLWQYVTGHPGNQPTSEWQDFDPARKELVRLAKLAFPYDPQILALTDSRNP